MALQKCAYYYYYYFIANVVNSIINIVINYYKYFCLFLISFNYMCVSVHACVCICSDRNPGGKL